MKRIIALSLCLLMLGLFAACGRESSGDSEPAFVEAAVTNPAYTEPQEITYPSGSVTLKVPLTFLRKEDNTDFSELVILVDGNAYLMDPDADLLPYTLAQTCMIYQGYTTATKYKCRVLVKDEETGGAVRDETYQQTNKDLNG